MKRLALLIGNSNGLQGVKLDLNNWSNFLKSDTGGQWLNNEILIQMNPPKQFLIQLVQYIKLERYDFVIVVFSGHGAYKKGTILEINEKDECIYEYELKNIALRQISVFDCCRNVIPSLSEQRSDTQAYSNLLGFIDDIRQRYETRIMQSIAQQVSLYSCSVGESSLDTNLGGLYTKHLLNSTKNVNGGEYKTVGIAHSEASSLTINEAIQRGIRQTPDSEIPRCLSAYQLIISINPHVRNRNFIY